MESNREYIFVFCKDYSEFLQYKKDYPNENCEFIVDENTMRGRNPSKVIRSGRYEERWDYIAIEDQIETMEAIWEQMREKKKKRSR
jgi:uncharacterized protein YdiU (UPF0061 family)